MALQRVPWAVNGEGVAHSATLARQGNYAALGGQTGIVGPYSLEVTAGETPGPHVTVAPGAGTLTYAQGYRQQFAYAQAKDQLVPVRNDALAEVPINPTTSAGGRVDLVCIEINDPEFEGTSGSVDYSDHEFVRFRVIQGVSSTVRYPQHIANTHGRPVLPLARVHIPASTATITDDMITDLRFMAQSRSSMDGTWKNQSQDVTISSDSWTPLESFGGILMPQWATYCRVSGTLSSGIVRGSGTGTFTGQIRAIANFGRADRFRWTTYIREEQVASGTRLHLPIQGWFYVYADERGREGSFRVEGRRTFGQHTFTMPEYAGRYDLTFHFVEAPTIAREDELED